MRLELKILAVVFLLIGVYMGVARLRESQIDDKNVPGGLVLGKEGATQIRWPPWF